MGELYTSLTRLKMAIRGELPPMTPLTEEAKTVVNEAFVPGMGALNEHQKKGLQCPICGAFHHELSIHISMAHPQSKAREVRRVLGINQNTPLVSAKASRKRKAKNYDNEARRKALNVARKKISYDRQAKSRTFESRATDIGERNLRDRCEAQLRLKFYVLAERLGRTPSALEFQSAYAGTGLFKYVLRLYGTWNNAKAQFGLPVIPAGAGVERYTVSDVLDGLRAWHDAHHRLPGYKEAKNPDRAPLICNAATIMRQLKADTWDDAMKRASALLGIKHKSAVA